MISIFTLRDEMALRYDLSRFLTTLTRLKRRKRMPVKISFLTFGLIGAIAFGTPTSAHAQTLSPEQKTEVETMLRDYILNNGDVIIESVNKFQARQEEEANKKASEKAKVLIEQLKSDKNLAYAGNPDGDVMVVEFFDLHCGYCKKAFTEIQTLLKEDPNVKVVFYDMPILGPDSYTASKWSLAAKKQGKYFPYHAALIQHQGEYTEDVLTKLAKDVGLDTDQLKKDAADPAIEEEIKEHLKMAQELGINGTPGFLVGEKIFRGYIPYDELKNAIAEVRKAAKPE